MVVVLYTAIAVILMIPCKCELKTLLSDIKKIKNVILTVLIQPKKIITTANSTVKSNPRYMTSQCKMLRLIKPLVGHRFAIYSWTVVIMSCHECIRNIYTQKSKMRRPKTACIIIDITVKISFKRLQ